MGPAEVWGPLVDRIHEPPVRLEACVQLARCPLGPGKFETKMDQKSLDFLRGLRKWSDPKQLETAAHVEPVTFGRWRNEVWDFEASEASKLQVIGWALKELYEMRDHPGAKVAIIDHLATGFGDELVKVWRVSDFRIDGDYRAWAIRTTRRYDLLPKMWRFV